MNIDMDLIKRWEDLEIHTDTSINLIEVSMSPFILLHFHVSNIWTAWYEPYEEL